MNKRGVTLIETIVYMALFAILIGGAVVAAYNLFEGSGRGQTHAMLQEEGDFLLGKVSWSLTGIKSVAVPVITSGTCSPNATSLTVAKWDAAVGTVVLTQIGNNLTITEGGSVAPVILNSADVSISNLVFVHCAAGSTNPESVLASFTLTVRTPNGMPVTQDFTNTFFVRR